MSSSTPRKAIVAPSVFTKQKVQAALASLKRRGSKRNREVMTRYANRSEHILGVSVADIRAYAKQLGRNHQLAIALWKTRVYEARLLAVCVAEPEGDAGADGSLGV